MLSNKSPILPSLPALDLVDGYISLLGDFNLGRGLFRGVLTPSDASDAFRWRCVAYQNDFCKGDTYLSWLQWLVIQLGVFSLISCYRPTEQSTKQTG